MNESGTKNTRLRKYGVGAGLLAGGIALGSMFAPIGLVDAQESDTSTADNSADSDRGRRGPRHHEGRSEVVTELLGLTQEELKAGFEEGKTLVEIAAEQGVSEAELVEALVTAATDRINQAVVDGKLTEEEAAEKIAGLEEAVTTRVNAAPGEGHRGGHGRPGRHFRGEVLEELGLDRDDVRAGLQDGQTLAEIAADAGVSEADLIAALVEAANERIDQALEDGKITAEEAAEKKASVEEKITERVNAEPGEGRRGGHGHRGQSDEDPDA